MNIDLTTLVPEFPEQPQNEIPRDALIERVAKLFGRDCQKLIITSGQYYGKTNFLAQFCRHHPLRAISYFFTANPTTRSLYTFHYVLLSQVYALLGKDISNHSMTMGQQASVLVSSLSALSTKARNSGEPYYIVIDGLENCLADDAGKEIRESLPSTFRDSPYLLVSFSTTEVDALLPPSLTNSKQHPVEDVLVFGLRDTMQVLSDLDLSHEEIERIHENSSGLPIYVSLMRESILEIGKERALQGNMPDNISRLLSKNVTDIVGGLDTKSKEAVEFLASSPKPLPEEILTNLTNLTELQLAELRKLSKLIVYEPAEKTYWIRDILKINYLRDRLGNKTTDLNKRILKVIDNSSVKDEKLVTLLQQEVRDLDGLLTSIQPQNLRKNLGASGDISLLLERIQAAAKVAKEEKDLNATVITSWVTLSAKAFLSNAISFREISALISLGEIDEAIGKAYSLEEPISKVRLLARAYSWMKEKKHRIPQSALEELQSMVIELQLERYDKEIVKALAIDIYRILPDVTYGILERLFGTSESKNLLEIALSFDMIGSQEKPDTEDLAKISDPTLSFIAKVHSSWLEGLTLAELIRDVDELDTIESKEFMIRQWCLQNLDSDELPYGIDLWLNHTIADKSFNFTLRGLRQISRILSKISDIPEVKRLVSRIEVPGFTALRTPWEEWVGFQLNLAEAINLYDAGLARERVERIYEEINTLINDLDIKVFCYARLWGAVLQLNLPIDQEIKGNLERVLSELLESSALQDEIFDKTIRLLAAIDPPYSIEVANRLNTEERRKNAIAIALVTAFRRHSDEPLKDLFVQSIKALDHIDIENVLLSITEELWKRKLKVAYENQAFLFDQVQSIKDPLKRSESLVNLCTIWSYEEKVRKTNLIELAITSWRLEVDLRYRIEAGFEYAEKLADINLDLAKKICTESQELGLEPGASISTGDLGTAYIHSLEMAIRSLKITDFEDHEIVDRLAILIKGVPASTTQAKIFARFASKAFSVGIEARGRAIVGEHLLKSLEPIKDASLTDYEMTVSYCLPVIFKYQVSLAEELASTLPRDLCNKAWFSTLIWLAGNNLLGDAIDLDSIGTTHDQPSIKDGLLRALNEILYDSYIQKGISICCQVIQISYKNKRVDTVQANLLLKDLEELANRNLPDAYNNIPHEGYRVVALSSIAKTRNYILKHPTGKSQHIISRDVMKRQWAEVVESARAIPNIADRVYVMAKVAADYSSFDDSKALDLLKMAAQEAESLPSLIDRSSRLEAVGEQWGKWGESEKAKYYYGLALKLAEELDPLTRDQKLELVVQTVYEFNPDFAEQIVQTADSRFKDTAINPYKLTLEAKRLLTNPTGIFSDQKLSDLEYISRGVVIRMAARNLLRDLNSGKSVTPHPDVLIEWASKSNRFDPNVIKDVLTWVTECITRQSSVKASDLARDYILGAETVYSLASWISPARHSGLPEEMLTALPGLSAKYTIFKVGDEQKARDWILEWLKENAMQSLVICDPYFGPTELAFLRVISPGCYTRIVTSSLAMKGQNDTYELRKAFLRYWFSEYNEPAPHISIMIIPSSSETSFHDRVIITQDGGLDIGSSLNGIGKKFQRISELTNTEAKELENNYVINLQNQALRVRDKNFMPTLFDLGRSD